MATGKMQVDAHNASDVDAFMSLGQHEDDNIRKKYIYIRINFLYIYIYKYIYIYIYHAAMIENGSIFCVQKM